MRKRALLVSAVALVAVLVAGGLFASNMGFKLNYSMEKAGFVNVPVTGGNSRTGTQTIALPYNQQTNLLNANDLLVDIGGTAVVVQIAAYTRSSDAPAAYTGTSGSPFALTAGEAYYCQISGTGQTPVNYIVVGSHNPGLGINLIAQAAGVSRSGSNLWSYPYHSTAANAKTLLDEINAFGGAGTVFQVGQYVQSGDIFAGYTGATGVAFPLLPGEGYLIQVNSNVSGWVPSHY